MQVQNQDVVDALPLLKQAQVAFSSFEGATNSENFLTVSGTIKYFELFRNENNLDNVRRNKISFATTIPIEFLNQHSLILNNSTVDIGGIGTNKNEIYYLGSQNFLETGLNVIEAEKKKFLFWFEENKLQRYVVPYTNSFAIISAIDNYDPTGDPAQRRPTGYRQLSVMVEHAKQLAIALQYMGFPKENILELYNEDATSKAITDALTRFWEGGDNSSADRLFFYFGGHGDTFGQSAGLITYDFEPKRPTLTSLLMRDITGRQFENVSAHYFLVAIDSCQAGLALSLIHI